MGMIITYGFVLFLLGLIFFLYRHEGKRIEKQYGPEPKIDAGRDMRP